MLIFAPLRPDNDFCLLALRNRCRCAKQFAVYYIIKWSRGWNLTLGLPGAFSNVWGILLKKRKGNNWNTPRSEIISYSATEGVWLLWCQAMKYIYQRRFFSLTKINLLLTRFVCERKKWCMFFSFFLNFYFAHCIYSPYDCVCHSGYAESLPCLYTGIYLLNGYTLRWCWVH